MTHAKTGNRWQLVVSRRNCILRINLVLHGASISLKNEINFDNNQVLALSYNNENGVYNDEECLKRMGLVILKSIKHDPNFIQKNINHCIEVSENLVKASKESEKDEHLLEAFKKYVNAHHMFSAFMFFPIGIEKIITNIVREGLARLVPAKEFQDTLNNLTTPSKVLESTQEQLDLMELVLKVKKGKPREALLEEHRKKYCYLNVYNQDEDSESLKSYRTRLTRLLEEDVEAKLKEFYKDISDRDREFEETVKKLKIEEELLNLVTLLREYVYLRSYRLEMLNKSNIFIQPILKRIGEKVGLSLREVCAMTAEEIINSLEGGDLPVKEIQKRLKGYVYIQQKNNYKIYTDGLESIKELEFGKEQYYGKLTELKGTPACEGIVKGKVRVILSKEEISLLEEGEILVTSMTTPDFVIAMEKSAAIVTDEGGILCHAAIVSREMKIPCIIGTQISTKVFNTGDLVKVDANKGIVRKIKNALVYDLTEINKNSIQIAGGKGASLGEMINSGFSVPPGFIISSSAFDIFIENMKKEIDLLLKSIDKFEPTIIENVSSKIKKLILCKEIPDYIVNNIKNSFRSLDSKFVAVRSSATVEDGSLSTWAGQLDTYLNTTEEDIINNIKKCWASLFSPRAIFYRLKKGYKDASVAVVVQKMIEGKISGIAFSMNPVTKKGDQIVIEFSIGLGENIVSGKVTPSRYIINKCNFEIVDKQLNENEIDISKDQIKSIAEEIIKIEKHYGFPVDIEWTIDKSDDLSILQSRPITALD